MKIPDSIKSFFTFSKTERIGIAILLLGLMTALISPAVYRHYGTNETPLFSSDSLVLVTMNQPQEEHLPRKAKDEMANESTPTPTKKPISKFNPNLISSDEWVDLGLKTFQAKMIIKYLSKGGKFKVKSDLLKIYTIDPSWFEQVKSFIELPDTLTQKPANQLYTQHENKFQKKEWNPVDINTADSETFVKLPGVGPFLASKIIKFRNKLGGFYCKEQIREVWGLKEESYQMFHEKITVASRPQYININSCAPKDLANHPYISHKLANIIVNYRQQHSKIKSVEELKTIPLMSDSLFNKVKHYISLN